MAESFTQDLSIKLRKDRQSINKFEIARTVLTRLNEKGEPTLRERREILKRVTEFEDFSTCWPNDQLKAKGLVAEIRRVINVKDTFTRINQERQDERRVRIAKADAKIQAVRHTRARLEEVQRNLAGLFAESDPIRRGKTLEQILNSLFQVSEILVKESFTVKGHRGEGIIEQIDGVVEMEGHHYLVEMKWWNKRLGKPQISESLVNIYHRGQARGIFISASGYSDPAITMCKEALQKAVVVLCDLEELVQVLERKVELKVFLRAKVNAAMTDKNPYHKPFLSGDFQIR